jgi:hypothetical protein
MLAEKEFRKHVVDQVTDSEVKAFWTQEFAKYTDKFASEATAAIQNKVGQFVSNPLIRNLVGQLKSSFDMREAMDQRKIILVDISKGRIGEDASRLLGAMLITKIQLAAMSRVNIPKHERADFCLIVDEFHSFATASFANILSEARKFNLSLVVAHQYIKQLPEEVAWAAFGNVGTIIAFRVGAEDAEFLEQEFAPEFMATDIVNLGFRQIYLKLMIDGVTSHAFSAMTMDTPAPLEHSTRAEVIEYSRSMYTRPRADVEAEIAKWREPMAPAYAPRDSAPPRHDAHTAQRPAFPARQQYGPQLQGGGDRGPRPPRRDDRRPRQQQGSPRRDDRPRPQQPAPARSPQQPFDSAQGKPGVSLGQLGQKAVDFKGRPLEEKPKTAPDSGSMPPTAELTSASFGDVHPEHGRGTQDKREELRDLIARALGKK